MERKLASIRIIKEIKPIESADSIEVCKVDGWHCVIKKDEFKVGDMVIYCEIDSLMPHTDERFEFLRPRRYRVRTIKLRGQISQGLILPVSYLPDISLIYEGMDVTEILGITKYEPPIPAHLMGHIKGNFPTHLVPKTDEERVQNLQELLDEYNNHSISYTEKLDGSSHTSILFDGEFRICSRNMELLETEDNAYWKVARLEKVEEKLRKINKNIAIQGEMIGFGIQGNKYALKSIELWVYNVYDITNQKYYKNSEVIKFCKENGFKCVPYLGEFELTNDIDQLIEMARGKSNLNPKINREGIVIRVTNSPDHVSFKAINPDFLLKYE